MGEPEAVDPLIEVLKYDKNGSVRLYAARALGELGDIAATIPLIESLQEDRNVDVRVRAARALGRLGGEEVVLPLVEALSDDNSQVCMTAADALIEIGNIAVKPLSKDTTVVLNDRISVTPLEVPHRDEYTETVGFLIEVQTKKALFIPDIDKWQKWDRDIVQLVKEVDVALLDATFFKDGEIQRDMNEVPHPFVEESIALFNSLDPRHRAKIYFTHFNHTNPLLDENSQAQQQLKSKGYNSAQQEMIIQF